MKALKFLREVKAEGKQVVWPSMASTRMFTLGVFILVFLVATYLWFVDLGLSFLVGKIIGVE